MDFLGLGIPVTAIVQGGWLLLALSFCWSIVLGRLIPKGQVEQLMETRAERITDLKEEVDSLKNTLGTLEKVLDKQEEVSDEITEAIQAMNRLVQALQEELAGKDDS